MGRRGGAVEKISITFGPYVACEPVKEVFLYPNQTTDTIMGDIKKMGLEFDLDEQVAQDNYSNLAEKVSVKVSPKVSPRVYVNVSVSVSVKVSEQVSEKVAEEMAVKVSVKVTEKVAHIPRKSGGFQPP